MAVEALQEKLGAPSSILLHPLLIRRGETGTLTLEHARFNAYDSSSVREVIALAGSELRLCSTNPAGTCDVPRGAVAVVLSELQDLQENGVGVGAVVVDGRDRRPAQRYFLLRVNAGSGGWQVVEVRSAT